MGKQFSSVKNSNWKVLLKFYGILGRTKFSILKKMARNHMKILTFTYFLSRSSHLHTFQSIQKYDTYNFTVFSNLYSKKVRVPNIILLSRDHTSFNSSNFLYSWKHLHNTIICLTISFKFLGLPITKIICSLWFPNSWLLVFNPFWNAKFNNGHFEEIQDF